MLIAQISDTHVSLGSPADAARLAALDEAIAHLQRLPARPDLVLITGDCTHNGTNAEYARFQERLAALTMPAFVIPGNHDHRENLLAAFGPQGDAPLDHFVQFVIDRGPLRVIALDTHIPGQDAGELCDRRLAWFEARLEEAPQRPTLICMHHPPFQTGMTVFDEIGLRHAERFGAIVARHPQIEAIVAGHLHAHLTRRFHGTLALTCTATAHQLLPDFRYPARVDAVIEPPSCLLHRWQPGTRLVSYSSPIGDHGPTKKLHDGEKWLG